MNANEQKLLGQLFVRTKQAADTPRDPEAEHFIIDQVKAQPSAPYLLTQAVIVQEQALNACHERIQALESQVADLKNSVSAQEQSGGLLGSIFGNSRSGQPSPLPQTTRAGGPWSPGPLPQDGSAQQGVPPQRGPWANPQQVQPQGGSFLQGALSTAAGVAGGALMFEGIKDMIGGRSMFGGSDSGIGSAQQEPTGETIVNNYYTDDKDNYSQNTDAETDRSDDAPDSSSDEDADDDSSA